MVEDSRYSALAALMRDTFKITTSTGMAEGFHQMETATKGSSIIMTCMAMGSILIWKTISDMKAFGSEARSREFSEFMTELAGFLNV